MPMLAKLPDRAPTEPMRDYLIYAHWLTTGGRDDRATATRLGLSPLLVSHLATAWRWHHRLTTMTASPAETTTESGHTHRGRATVAGNDPLHASLVKNPAHPQEMDIGSMSQWWATTNTNSSHHGAVLHVIDQWPLAYLADLINLAPSTRAGYLADMARYLEWCERDGLDPLAANRADIARYRDDLMRGTAMPTQRAASAATVHRRIAVVRHLYDWLTLAGLTPACPARPLPLPVVDPHVTALRRPWLTTGERRRVLDLTDRLADDGSITLRDRAIAYLLAYGAPRVAEISALTVSCLADGALTWTGKGGRSRTIRLVAGVADALEAYLCERRRALMSGARLPGSAPLFVTRSGRPVQPRQIRKLIARLCRWAEVPHRSPHAWRHGLITAARQAGMTRDDVQAYVGHARGDTTARYEHLAPARRLDAGAWLWESDREARSA